jgi:hypothetical protein
MGRADPVTRLTMTGAITVCGSNVPAQARIMSVMTPVLPGVRRALRRASRKRESLRELHGVEGASSLSKSRICLARKLPASSERQAR